MLVDIDDILDDALSWLNCVLVVIEGAVYQAAYSDDDEIVFLALPEPGGS